MSRLFLLAAVAAVSLAGSCSAPKSDNAPATPESLAAQLEQSLEGLKRYSFDVNVTVEANAQGGLQKVEMAYTASFDRPDRWAIIHKSGEMGGTSVSDGKEVTTFSPMLSRYTVTPLSDARKPATVLGPQIVVLGAAALRQYLMGEGLKDWILDDVTSAKLVGNEDIDGKHYRVAEYNRKDGTIWRIWVSDSSVALPRRVMVTTDTTGTEWKVGGKLSEMKLRTTVDFTNWNQDAQFSADTFVFDPPEDAQKVEALFPVSRQRVGPHPLLGEQAPEFSAKDLSDATVELASHHGKDVVILDFWASWCGPCTASLPTITEVAEKFADRNVVFYAVNVGETAEAVQTFLKESGLNLRVLFDTDSTVSSLYQVSGIPQTVLIDPKGRVQVVHIGFGGDLKERLTSELEDILAGKDLATPELQKAKDEASTEEPAEEEATAEIEIEADQEAIAEPQAPAESEAASEAKSGDEPPAETPTEVKTDAEAADTVTGSESPVENESTVETESEAEVEVDESPAR